MAGRTSLGGGSKAIMTIRRDKHGSKEHVWLIPTDKGHCLQRQHPESPLHRLAAKTECLSPTNPLLERHTKCLDILWDMVG